TVIEDYRARIEKEARRLALEQARLNQTKQTVDGSPNSAQLSAGSLNTSADRPAGATPLDGLPTMTREPEKNWIELDREKRTYLSRYAPNIALSHRAAPRAPAAEPGRGTPFPAPDNDSSGGPISAGSDTSGDLPHATGKTYR